MREELSRYQGSRPCEVCHGARLKPEALSVKIAGEDISSASRRSVTDALNGSDRSTKSSPPAERDRPRDPQGDQRAARLPSQCRARLSPPRPQVGHAQRRREPAHPPRQPDRLRPVGRALRARRAVDRPPPEGQRPPARDAQAPRGLGNTVLVVEHDEEAIRTADHVIDMGPAPGSTAARWCAPARSTSCSPAREHHRRLPLRPPRNPDAREAPQGLGQEGHRPRRHRQQPAATSPRRSRSAPSPASPASRGSGKSSLTIDTLYAGAARALNGARIICGPCEKITGLEHLDKVIDIDQSPIGRTPRSNPATYTGAFTNIRDWFAGLPEAKARGYKPGRFSFNVKGGRCEACKGDGLIKIEMHFLPDVYVTCDVCHGKRYNRETLEVKFKGHSIADVLDMTVEDAVEFFKAVPGIRDKMRCSRKSASAISRSASRRRPVGRRGAARQAVEGAVAARDRQDALHPRRADHRPAFRGRAQAARGAPPPGRAGQYGGGDRAQSRRHQDGGLGDRPGAGRRRERRAHHRRRPARVPSRRKSRGGSPAGAR
jgi:excinuclease ABC subunit A